MTRTAEAYAKMRATRPDLGGLVSRHGAVAEAAIARGRSAPPASIRKTLQDSRDEKLMSGAKLVGGLTLGAAGLATAAHLAKKPKTKKPKEPAMNKTSQFLKQATAPATSSFPKTAGYLKAMSSSGAWCGEVNYLDDFVGTPLYDRASALVEKELAIRAQRVQERLSRPRPSYEDSYDLEEQIRLDKDLLHLELHRLQNAQAQPGGGEVEAEFEDDGAPKIAAFLKLAAEAAGEVKYESRVADGDPRKSWPSAALGHVKKVV